MLELVVAAGCRIVDSSVSRVLLVDANTQFQDKDGREH
jgi:hypothetical protein